MGVALPTPTMAVSHRQDEGDDDGDEDGGDDGAPPTAEDLEEQFNRLEDALDELDTDDEYLAAFLTWLERLDRVERAQTDLLEEIRDLREQQADDEEDEEADDEPEIVGTFPIEMSHDVPSNTQRSSPNVVRRTPHEDGPARITQVALGWPEGAGNGVGIQLRTGDGLQLVPRNPEDDYIGFNDFADTFGLEYDLQPGEELVAQTVNLDQSNDHFVNIVPQIQEMVDTTLNTAAGGD